MMDRIAENVFLGDAKSAVNAEGIREYKVKRILTVASEPINEKCRVPEAEYKFIFMLDIDDQNIITSGILEQALNFMRETVNSGQAILVHCEYGISRSTTIVTAFLMARYRTAYHDTLAFVKSKHPLASPNSSFASQLRLFQKVGYITNTLALKRNPEFRDFAVCNGHLFGLNFNRDPTGTYTLIESKNLSTIKYSCQKCRDALFFDFNVIRHTIEKEEGEENIYCNLQYLTTPMEWMNLQEFRGKINCPNCNLKLGNYIWGGRECESIVELGVTCGKFVQPWIQIQVNRVDNSVLNKTE